MEKASAKKRKSCASESGVSVSSNEGSTAEKKQKLIDAVQDDYLPDIPYSRFTSQLEYLDKRVVPALYKHPKSWPFLEPVDVVKLNIPDYLDIIKEPMDIGTIRNRLSTNYYKNEQECLQDLDRVFSNCYEYNKPGSDVWKMCQNLEKTYRSLIAAMPQKLCCRPELKVGMRLEVEDRENSQVCCASIRNIYADWVQIHFDGWQNSYDLWRHPWCDELHPVGWCQENEVALSPPKTWKDVKSFTWEKYLKKQGAEAATYNALLPNVVPHGFAVGMKLEVEDSLNEMNCCATVVEISRDTGELLVHFDGWEDEYDMWYHVYSVQLHPVGWCKENNKQLAPPKEWTDGEFSWDAYLKKTHSLAVPKAAFLPKCGLSIISSKTSQQLASHQKRCPRGAEQQKSSGDSDAAVSVDDDDDETLSVVSSASLSSVSKTFEHLASPSTSVTPNSTKSIRSPSLASTVLSPLATSEKMNSLSPHAEVKPSLLRIHSTGPAHRLVPNMGTPEHALSNLQQSRQRLVGALRVSTASLLRPVAPSASNPTADLPQPVFPPDVVYNQNNEPVFQERMSPMKKPSGDPVQKQSPTPAINIEPITIEPQPEMRVTERISQILSNIQMLSESDVRNIVQIASSRLHADTQIELGQMFMRWNLDVLPHTPHCPCMNYKPKQT